MAAHIDKFGSALDSCNSCIANSLRLTYKCNNCAVGSLTGIYIEELNALSCIDNIGNLLDGFKVATLRKVGYALNNSFLHGFIVLVLI